LNSEKELSGVDWEQLFATLSTEAEWETFKAKLFECEEKHVPMKMVTSNMKAKPIWMTHN